MKRLVLSTVIILATLAALVLFWEFREALILFLFSLAVAAAVRPATDYWTRHGLNRGLAIMLTYLMILAVIGGLFYLIGRPFLVEVQQVTNNFELAYEHITATWPQGTPFQQAVVARLPSSKDLYQAIAGEQGAKLVQTTFGIAQGFLSVLAQFFIVLVLSIYWSADRVRFERLWLSLLPAEKRARAREIWRDIETGLGAYIRSELIQSLLAGILLGIGYALMGLQYPVLLALSSALFWLIPWLGALLAVVLPLMVGLGSSPALGASAAIFTFLVLLILEVLVEPRLFNRRRYSSLLIVVFVVAMADAFGLFGLVIAPPLAAAVQILFSQLMRTSSPAETVNPLIQVQNLRGRLTRLQESTTAMGEPLTPEVTNLMQRLADLVDVTEELFQGEDEQGKPSLGLPAKSGAGIEVR